MADTMKELRDDTEKQLGDMQKELGKLERKLSERLSSLSEAVEDALEDGRGHARKAMHDARDQAYYAADIARENPATVGTVITASVLIGIGIGYLMARSSSH